MDAKDKEKVSELIRQANELKSKISVNRDELRDLIYELQDIESGVDEAVEALEGAADAMSRLI